MKTIQQTRIAYIGVYADPDAPGGNNLLWTQASETRQLGYDIQIVTWPRPHAWTGNYPGEQSSRFHSVPILECERKGIPYYVISPAEEWGEIVPTKANWEKSVQWAIKLLLLIKPSILHQHFWRKTWFFMEAAIQLGIPTIYTVYDWGLPCYRQFLIRLDGQPCTVRPSVKECTRCLLSQYNDNGNYKPNAEMAIHNQIELFFERWTFISNRLSALIATSPFARQFYQSLGVNESKIHEMAWFYNQPDLLLPMAPVDTQPLRLGFLGRIVPEKGLHLLLETLEGLTGIPQLILEISGLINSDYARNLRDKYQYQAGKHRIVWTGWIPNPSLGQFFRRNHALVVPSLWYDNSPTVISESLAHHCPVICTDLPSMTHLVHHNINGLVFTINDSNQLAMQISRCATDKSLLLKLRAKSSYDLSAKKYAEFLAQVYDSMFPHSQDR